MVNDINKKGILLKRRLYDNPLHLEGHDELRIFDFCSITNSFTSNGCIEIGEKVRVCMGLIGSSITITDIKKTDSELYPYKIYFEFDSENISKNILQDLVELQGGSRLY